MTALEPRSWPLKSSFLVFQTIHIEVKFKTSQFYNFIAIFNWISNCMSTSSILLEAWQNISTIMVSSSNTLLYQSINPYALQPNTNPLNVFTYIDIYWKKNVRPKGYNLKCKRNRPLCAFVRSHCFSYFQWNGPISEVIGPNIMNL